jgi:hypothetical protein
MGKEVRKRKKRRKKQKEEKRRGKIWRQKRENKCNEIKDKSVFSSTISHILHPQCHPIFLHHI